MRKVAIVGAGAAGYFAAIQLAEHFPEVQVKLYEKSTPLAKVKVSGGGRCNVTHACFDPKELIAFYPRGGRELLGPFHHFQPGDMEAMAIEAGNDVLLFPSDIPMAIAKIKKKIQTGEITKEQIKKSCYKILKGVMQMAPFLLF